MSALQIGYCITPHGFGHAARAVAVMEAVAARTEVVFHLVTTVPEWFFQQSLSCPFVYHCIATDVGLVQHSALQEDMGATLEALASFYPLTAEQIDAVGNFLSDCSLILCDIAPIGIAVARQCGVPSVLIENFTWDWIYAGYAEQWPELRTWIGYLGDLFAQADYHIQTAPICRPVACDRKTAPVARRPRTGRQHIRERLGIGTAECMVLVTMGGISDQVVPLQTLRQATEWIFVLPGYADTLITEANLRLLPANSGFFHPDLIQASDVVIGKVGYSTLAEVYRAGVPFGYVRRADFRESGPLTVFIRDNMEAVELSVSALRSGAWLHQLPRLAAMKQRHPVEANGDDEVADFLIDLVR